VEHPERAALRYLDTTVEEAVARLAALRLRAEAAEQRSAELELLLRRFTQDDGAAVRALARLGALERENAQLRERLEQGRVGVERMMARLRFLEDQR
jgi:predicted nuclease with TOPRIM domain